MGGFQKNGQFCSQPSGLRPSQHTQWDYKLESCVSQSVAYGPSASELLGELIAQRSPSISLRVRKLFPAGPPGL